MMYQVRTYQGNRAWPIGYLYPQIPQSKSTPAIRAQCHDKIVPGWKSGTVPMVWRLPVAD